jgi:hypothetical protein
MRWRGALYSAIAAGTALTAAAPGLAQDSGAAPVLPPAFGLKDDDAIRRYLAGEWRCYFAIVEPSSGRDEEKQGAFFIWQAGLDGKLADSMVLLKGGQLTAGAEPGAYAFRVERKEPNRFALRRWSAEAPVETLHIVAADADTILILRGETIRQMGRSAGALKPCLG